MDKSESLNYDALTQVAKGLLETMNIRLKLQFSSDAKSNKLWRLYMIIHAIFY